VRSEKSPVRDIICAQACDPRLVAGADVTYRPRTTSAATRDLSPSVLGKWIKLRVKTTSGASTVLRLEPTATIDDVKSRMAELVSPRSTSPKLILNGREVKEGTLAENCIDSSSALHFLRR
jgi:hypothetical protein